MAAEGLCIYPDNGSWEIAPTLKHFRPRDSQRIQLRKKNERAWEKIELQISLVDRVQVRNKHGSVSRVNQFCVYAIMNAIVNMKYKYIYFLTKNLCFLVFREI